jgi:hypothetical protein
MLGEAHQGTDRAATPVARELPGDGVGSGRVQKRRVQQLLQPGDQEGRTQEEPLRQQHPTRPRSPADRFGCCRPRRHRVRPLGHGPGRHLVNRVWWGRRHG